MEKNLTTGSVWGNVVSFSLPYLLSYFLQTLYGMADFYIIGQFEGPASITAVAVGSQVMHMLTVMLVGLAMGATVSIGQAVGGGDRKAAAGSIGNTSVLFAGLALGLTALLLALRRVIPAVMSTLEEAVSGTVAYLTVCFAGIPFITAYNVISSIFRGMGGQQKSPVLYCGGLRCEHRAGLLADGRAGPRPCGRGAGHHPFSGGQRAFGAAGHLPAGPWASSDAGGLPPAPPDGGKAPAHRCSGGPAGWVYSDLLPAHHRDRQPPGADRRGGGGDRGKDRELPVPCSVHHALHRVRAGGAGGRGADGGPFHAGYSGGPRRRPISAGLCVGLPVRRGAVQLQRVFLRLRAVGALVFA